MPSTGTSPLWQEQGKGHYYLLCLQLQILGPVIIWEGAV